MMYLCKISNQVSSIFNYTAESIINALASIGMLLSMGVTAVIWSVLSKMIPQEELGQFERPEGRRKFQSLIPRVDFVGHVLSVAVCLEAIVPLIASPVYNELYKATLATFPGTIFLLDVAVSIALMILLSYYHFISL